MPRTTKNATPKKETNFKYDIAGLALIALALIGFAGVFTSSVGQVGLLIKQGLAILTGKGYAVFLIVLIVSGIKIMKRDSWQVNARFWGFVVLFGSLQIFLHRHIYLSQSFEAGLRGEGGGLIGAALGSVFKYCFGTVGTNIMLVFLTLVGVTLCTASSVKDLGGISWHKLRASAVGTWQAIINFVFVEADEDEDKEQSGLGNKIKKKFKKNPDPPGLPESTELPVIEITHNGNEDGLVKEEINTPDRENTTDEPQLPVENTFSKGQEYHLPPLSLLNQGSSSSGKNSGKDINQKITTLEQTLESFGIKAKVTHVAVGPSITRYELQPPAGVKVSKIVGLSDDIALGMATTGVRIEAPIPGKAAVGIEVPNDEISTVSLRELLECKNFTGSTSRLTVALGKDIAGTPVIADLAKMPHLLIAGATGSGKSVCVNTLISSILFKATPEDVKFLMVDPKMVELANYNDIPHLVSPVVTDAKKAAGALRWAVREMESRYDLFAAAGVRDITRYNAMFEENENEPGQTPLPYIVVIIDELADLMMVAPADVEDSICRLAQMARAAGLHLVVATQRPSVDVITGLIKANIPSRISFAVSSQMDSRTILDMGGAEKLLGKGDMLFYPVGASKPIRVQGAFLSDREVENLVDFLKDQARPVYNEAVLQEQPGGGENVGTEEESDELLPQATKLFIESGTASISMLQRRLHIGYSRAARLVDIMERRGIVGGFEGSKPRSVLMTMEQYQQVFENTSARQETKTVAS
ncbi:DNA segregation ATPase FtsK/SpoIIIE, S-DNA-T family [Desulfotomaculum arcticum]|uniref:DNA segregation ATPase FtsK/SpoIIIE, S-DNA-T family n=1 Tax=Desulfotruncus arcticus DSM 17038 TaxID=1121424 RepID=A0A1I2Q7S4_9FIRM|nr:DNA translocase FtsK [Desulfotruncus arcticus]SFG23713.1 DNA segregation ATPase FtsK/SpoIIIE, S-DNA-T family [Desulfotomaculum arcticum] [Desulfotruncus arcticus DSM 17038]